MPSFDIVSEVDKQEIDNAINQARKELATRFDFKGTTAEVIHEKDKIILTAEDAARLRGLREIVVGKLGKRGVDLRNIDQQEPAISSMGHARQELKIQQGLEGNKAKEIIQAIKAQGFKVQSQLQDRQIREVLRLQALGERGVTPDLLVGIQPGDRIRRVGPGGEARGVRQQVPDRERPRQVGGACLQDGVRSNFAGPCGRKIQRDLAGAGRG